MLALMAAGIVSAAALTVSAEPLQVGHSVAEAEIKEFEQRAPTILPPI